MTLHRIIYTSQASEQFDKRSLLNLLHESRAFNSIDKITGVLMYKKGCFLQVIEGEVKLINDLMTRILRDKRHNGVKILLDSSADNRLFPNWAMGCADFEDPKLSLIPGIRTDLNDPQVIKKIIINLPEIAGFLLENID